MFQGFQKLAADAPLGISCAVSTRAPVRDGHDRDISAAVI
jgi:hypothetical protein